MWDAYATIVDLSSKPAAYQKSLFITCVGKDALPIVHSLPYAAESDRDDLTKILELLEAYCVGDEQVTFERYKFHQRVQGEAESADELIAALRTLVQTCNFVIDGKDFSRQMIRDRIVCGMRNNAVRRKLLAIADVGLDKCVQEIKSAEVAAGHAQKMDQCVKTRATEANLEKVAGQREADVCAVQQQRRSECDSCGRMHGPGACPAVGRQCNNCGGYNHFAARCRSAQWKRKPRGGSQLYWMRSSC